MEAGSCVKRFPKLASWVDWFNLARGFSLGYGLALACGRAGDYATPKAGNRERVNSIRYTNPEKPIDVGLEPN